MLTLFDKFEYKGTVTDMVKSTDIMKKFAFYLRELRLEAPAPEVKEEEKTEE